jgi:hypothetical protein
MPNLMMHEGMYKSSLCLAHGLWRTRIDAIGSLNGSDSRCRSDLGTCGVNPLIEGQLIAHMKFIDALKTAGPASKHPCKTFPSYTIPSS